MDILIDLLLTSLLTSVGWYVWWLWYRPRYAKIIADYTITRCFTVFQQAMLQVAMGQVPPLPEDSAQAKDTSVN